MLSLVISNPLPARSGEVKNARLEFRRWIELLEADKRVLCFYPKIGRGSVVIFDVQTNEELHVLLTQWNDIVPASFDIHPLVSPKEAEKLLR